MSYLGRGLEQVDNISKLDNITFNGGTTYALTKDSAAFTPISSNALLVSIDGVIQQGNFSVSGTNIVFNFSPTGSNTCDFIMHYGTGVAFTPADSSITKDKTNFVSTSSAAGLEVKGDGTTDGTLQLNCRVNSHGIKLKSPPHSAGASYTLTFPNTDGNADQVLKTNGSGVLDWVDSASPYYVQLANTTISDGDASEDFQNVFSSTYRNYLILFEGITVNTNSADLQLIFMKSDNSTPSEHTYAANGHFYGADNNWTGSNSSNVTIMQGQGSGAGKQVSGFINVFQPNFTTDGAQRYTWHVSVRRHDSNNGYVTGGGNNATNSARTGFKVKCNSGTLGAGRVVVYGITNPS